MLDISRAEQEPLTAQQEQCVDTNPSSLHYPLYPFVSHELDSMATGTVGVDNNAQHTGQSSYHGDDDDYIEVTGTHRRSPIFI